MDPTRLRPGFAAIVALGLVLGSPGPADAFPLYVFSWATGDSEGRGYSGLKMRRKVVDVQFSAGQSSTVYDTMWVTTTEPGTWLELGTHYSGAGIRTFYGYGDNGTFHFLNDFAGYNTVGDYHNYRIDQGLADCWWLYVDGNQLGSY